MVLKFTVNKIKIEGSENIAKKIISHAETKSTEKIDIAEKRAKEILSDAEKASQNLKKRKAA